MTVDFTRNVTNGVMVIIEKSGDTFHSIDDYGLAIANTDYIGTPEIERKFIDVPFRDGLIDVSEVMAGRVIYKKRPIYVKFKGIKEIADWDSIISDIRNRCDGKICKLVFDNDKNYYWIGRVSIAEFTRHLEAGTFALAISQADAFKYDVTDSTEDWLWDCFDFVTGVITTQEAFNPNNNTYNVTIPSGHRDTVPEFNCKNVQNLRIQYSDENANSFDKLLQNGVNRFLI